MNLFHSKQKNILKENNYVINFECNKDIIIKKIDSNIRLVEDCLNKSAKSWIEDTSDLNGDFSKIGHKRSNTAMYTPLNKKKSLELNTSNIERRSMIRKSPIQAYSPF